MQLAGSAAKTRDALLERQRELDEINGLLDEARAGSGGLLVIEGSAGIGKTRLLDAGRAAAAEQGVRVLSARASELDREFPFGVVRQWFESPLAAADEPERARLLGGVAGPAGSLLGGQPPEGPSHWGPSHAGPSDGGPSHGGPSDGGPSDGDTDQPLMLFHALYWLTVNLSEGGPMLIVVDDAHWADQSSLRFVQFLTARLRELPVLVALAARIGEPSDSHEALDALAADSLSQVIRLNPLTRDAVQALVEEAYDGVADPSFCAACHEATGGNPLLVRELLRELDADGVMPTAATAPLVRQLGPSTVARAVLLRVARLGEGASKLARAVAVLGDDVPLPRACALAGVDEDEGQRLALRLAQADVFAPARPLSFAHPILRAAVYAELDPGERVVAHRRAAELLATEGVEVDAVAVHLLATEPRGDAQVVDRLRQAATWAISRGATQTAVLCMRRALEEPPEPGERPRLTLELARAELRTGDAASANDHFQAGIAATPDACLRARFAWDHALALQALGRHEEAFTVRERAVDDVRDADRDLAFSLEASLIASARLELSRLDWAKTRLEHCLAQPGLPERAEQRMRATRAQIIAFDRSSTESASMLAAIADRALASGHLIDGTTGVTTPFFSAVELLGLADRPQPARHALDQLLEASRRRGSLPGFAFACGWRCLLLTREGSLSEAEADARSCADLALAQGWFRLAPLVLGYVLDALIERDQLADAQRILQDSGIGDQGAAATVVADPVIHARARLRALAGDLAAARSDLASLERRNARWNTYPSLVPPVLVAPELIGEAAEKAKVEAEVMLREAHVWNTPRAIGMALRANARLCEGGTRVELLREAAAVLEASPARVEHARALVDLGAALRAGNHRAAAREPLRQALDIAHASGAILLSRRANHELRAAGGRPRRARTAGPQALTASERRIAGMAAEGRSNPEIAQALFITKKTVEAHLASAYRKLEIHSRSQLEFALRETSGSGVRRGPVAAASTFYATAVEAPAPTPGRRIRTPL